MATKMISYELVGNRIPITYQLHTQDKKSKPLKAKVEDKNGRVSYRPMRLCDNQKSFYIDEQTEFARVKSLVMEDGILNVDSDDSVTNEFLAIHPDNIANGGRIFRMIDKKADALAELEEIEIEDRARELAKDMTHAEKIYVLKSIMANPRLVDDMSKEEIDVEIRIFAKRNPKKMLEFEKDSTNEQEQIIDLALEHGVLFKKEFQNYTEIHKKFGEKGRIAKVDIGQDIYDELMDYFFKNEQGRNDYAEMARLVEEKINS